MGRYATINLDYREDREIKCSGVLAQSIHEVIGKKRFEEWLIILKYEEVILVMEEMIRQMSSPIPLSHNEITARKIGYNKLHLLSLWVNQDAISLKEALEFC